MRSASKREFCRIVREDHLERLRGLGEPDVEVWWRDKDKLRRWVNQNKKSRHWPGHAMSLAELRQHREYLMKAKSMARGEGATWDSGQYLENVDAQIAIAMETGDGGSVPVSVFSQRRGEAKEGGNAAPPRRTAAD